MIPIRESGETTVNPDLVTPKSVEAETNVAWFRRQRSRSGVLLLGGTSLLDFRMRVAQSLLRGDLTPSYWSVCGLLTGEDDEFLGVPLDTPDVSAVPATNAVRPCRLSDFDDPVRWPNIAVMRFADKPEVIVEQARLIEQRRSIVDLPELLLAWLAYGWAAGSADNPLLKGHGIPGAAFVEAAHSLAGVELTPGLSSAASCPEAIWQAVKWWRGYYADAVSYGGAAAAQPLVPRGRYLVRQRSAAMSLPEVAPAARKSPTRSKARAR
jgi:hypothetical protein